MSKVLNFVFLMAFLGGCRGEDGSMPRTAERTEGARSTVEQELVTLDVRAVPRHARLSDEIRLTIELSYDPAVQMELPTFGEGVGDFLIREMRQPLIETRAGREVRRQELLLEPMETGRLRIDPVTVVYRVGDAADESEARQIRSAGLAIEVVSLVDPQSVSLEDLSELRPPLEAANSWIHGFLILGVATIGVIALVILIASARHRPALPPQISPRQRALRELDELRAAAIENHDPKLFYIRLTTTVRTYLEAATDVPAVEQTTDEFLRAVVDRDEFQPEARHRLRVFLEAADLVKFARHQPTSADADTAFERARAVVLDGASAEVT
jgi:hypothetical protein